MTPTLIALSPDGAVPNNPKLPVVVVEEAVPGDLGAKAICAKLEANGWGGTWTWRVFEYHHYHPNAHEALVAARGWADLILGGPSHPPRRVMAGDAVVLPAGTGHCLVQASADFAVCGAYPPGQELYETLRADGAPPLGTTARIAAVPLPQTDPLTGPRGPVLDAWFGRIPA